MEETGVPWENHRPWTGDFYPATSSDECCNVLSLLLTKNEYYYYSWNKNRIFCLPSGLDIVYHVSVGIYKQLLLLKNDNIFNNMFKP